MSTVHMPEPPAGHYWQIGPLRPGYPYRRVYLMRKRRWWFDSEGEWSVFEATSDEHESARSAARVAQHVLDKYERAQRPRTSGLNGLTGYVDHKGRAH